MGSRKRKDAESDSFFLVLHGVRERGEGLRYWSESIHRSSGVETGFSAERRMQRGQGSSATPTTVTKYAKNVLNRHDGQLANKNSNYATNFITGKRGRGEVESGSHLLC